MTSAYALALALSLSRFRLSLPFPSSSNIKTRKIKIHTSLTRIEDDTKYYNEICEPNKIAALQRQTCLGARGARHHEQQRSGQLELTLRLRITAQHPAMAS